MQAQTALLFHKLPRITVVGLSPDGKKIIFSSSRARGAFPGVTTLFEIPAEGRDGTANPNRLGLFSQLFARWIEARIHAASWRLVA